MAWTKSQCDAVFENYWQSGSSRCPNDGAVFTLRLLPFLDGGYTIIGNCPRCGEGIQMNRVDDPRASQFRKWTNEERAALVNLHFQRRSMHCPVCESEVGVQEAAHFGGTFVAMRCIRCGNGHEQDFPHR